jgi:hypothetical protein
MAAPPHRPALPSQLHVNMQCRDASWQGCCKHSRSSWCMCIHTAAMINQHCSTRKQQSGPSERFSSGCLALALTCRLSTCSVSSTMPLMTASVVPAGSRSRAEYVRFSLWGQGRAARGPLSALLACSWQGLCCRAGVYGAHMCTALSSTTRAAMLGCVDHAAWTGRTHADMPMPSIQATNCRQQAQSLPSYP